LTKLK